VDILTVVLLLAGFVLLVLGGEVLVRGASGIAASLGMSPLLVGLTVVSFATSSPELAVSVDAALSGTPELALGNVIGSNIANILLILGLAALMTPMLVRSQLVRLDIPVMIALSLALLLFALDGTISTLDGALLLGALVAYVVLAIRVGRRSTESEAEVAMAPQEEPEEVARRPLGWNVALVVAGIALLVAGANWLVESASAIAASLGISDLVIGLTVVAVGTSLPELATSIIAAARGQRDLAVGNVVGSNIFNIGAVLGLSAVVVPAGIPVADAAIGFDIPIMLAVAVALLPVVFTGLAVARWEGGVFVAYYVAYTGYLLLDAAGHDALPRFSALMLWFVLPLTVLTLLVVTAGEIRLRRQGVVPDR
jgi:cation:H+ antiporter